MRERFEVVYTNACTQRMHSLQIEGDDTKVSQRTTEPARRVGNLNILQMPVRKEASAIMADVQTVYVRELLPGHDERVFVIALKVIGTRGELNQGCARVVASRVAAVQPAKYVGISACALTVARVHR